MTKLDRIFKTQLLLAVVLWGARMGFAQTVTVPANCRVVVAGVGGTLGFGQKVGEGGRVAMPDALEVAPFTTNQGGTFTFNPPVATPAITTATWKLLGDLSNVATTTTLSNIRPNITGQFNGVTQPPAGLMATILSYNKFLRVASTETTTNTAFARSKGQVKVGWSQPPCNNFITFDVFKTFTASLPVIVGPQCIKPNTDYTYSVDRIVSDNPNDNIGFDSYYWIGIDPALVASNGFYTSADNSSISFRTGPTVSEFKLSCAYGRVNPNTSDGGVSNINQVLATPAHTTSTVTLIRVAPTAPRFTAVTNLSTLATLNNSLTACLATGLPSSVTVPTFSLTFDNPAAGQIYTWSAQNSGWTWNTVPDGTTSSKLNVNTNNSNNPEQFTLTITGNNCEPVIINYQINRDFVAPLAIIAANTATTTCINSTSTANFYTISPNASSNSFVWSIDPLTPLAGVTLQNTTTNTVTVNTTNANTGSFNLRAKTGIGACSSYISLPITVKPVTPTITGTNCIVQGSTAAQTYTCASTPGATYTWTFPAGWGNSPQTTTTNSIILTPTSATAVLSGAISVVANGTANCNDTASLAINYQAVAPIGVTAGCFSIGIAGTGSSVTITNGQTTGSYTATLISTISGSTNVITSAVTTALNTPSSGFSTLSFNTSALTAGTYNVAITHNSGCTATASTTTLLTIAGNGASISPSFGATTDSYFAINSIPNPQYEWFVCDTNPLTLVTTCTSVGTNNITLTLNGALLSTTQQANRQVCVNVFSSSSTCKTRVCIGSGTHARQANAVVKIDTTELVAVYPNPSRGAFTIKIVDVKTAADAVMYTSDGKKVREFKLSQGENKIERNSLVTGNYYIIIDLEGKNVMKQILIN